MWSLISSTSVIQGRRVWLLIRDTAKLWVPIIHPCWSGSMPVLVEGPAEPVSSADIEVRDPPRMGNRFG